MKLVCLLVLFLAGCASYTQAEIDLVTQARRGIASAKVHQNDSHEIMRQAKARLDEAFDADVRAQSELSPDWVIEARKAYAIALDAYAAREAASIAADQRRAQNLAAADAALAKLQSLLEIQRRYSLEEFTK